MAPGPAGGTWRTALLVGLSIAALAWQAFRLDYIVDDAFISFRYARNLVDGAGLVYNPGGPRVEGYTNFLWTLILAAAMRLGLDPAFAARYLGLLSGAVILVLAERLARELGAGRWSALAAGLLALNPAFVTWSAAGLETAFFTALVLAGAMLAIRPGAARWWAGLALAAACLTRPEGILVAALVAAGVFLGEGRPGLARLAPAAASVALTVVAHTLWRRAYYGAWLPNTFYAKTGDLQAQITSGSAYVYEAIAAFGAGAFVVLLLGLAWKRGTAAAVALALLAGWLSYVVIVGGDGLPMYRFIVPALPPLSALAAAALAGSTANRTWLARGAALAALGLTMVPGWHGHEHAYLESDRMRFVPKVVSVGGQLRRFTGPSARIALLPAGAIPYLSGLETIDMLALNDPVVARKKMRFAHAIPGHWKYDAAEVLRQRPDYVLLGNVDVTDQPRAGFIPPRFQVEADMVALEEFQREYELVSFPLREGGWLNCYRRRGAPRGGGPPGI